MNSSWAYNNGKREDAKVKASLKVEKTGWIKRGGTYLYAERNKYDETKLMVKTYSNKKQADAMVGKQKELGIDAYRSFKHPFTILTAEIKQCQRKMRFENCPKIPSKSKCSQNTACWF